MQSHSTLVSLLLERAMRHPARTAIIEACGKTISYGELAHQSTLMAAYLQQQGIRSGDHILVALWPGIALYKSLAALWRLGATAIFPEPATGLAGLRQAAASLQPKALMSQCLIQLIRPFFSELRAIKHQFNPEKSCHHVFDTDLSCPQAAALISFTSGTTNRPKAMARSHGLLLAQHQAMGDILASGQPQTDLVAFPAVALSCLGYGHRVILPNWNLRQNNRAKPEIIWRQIEQYQVTRLIVPPVIVENLVQNQRRREKKLPSNHSLKQVITGGSPLYPDMMREFTRIFPDIDLHILYGSTEAEPISHLNVAQLSDEDWQKAFNGGGLPVGNISPHTFLHLDEKGEIQVAGAHVNESYLDASHNSENKILHQGRIYHRTGDMGRLDKMGKLWLLGRIATMPPDGVADALSPFALEIKARSQAGVKEAAAMRLDDKLVLAISGVLPVPGSAFGQFLTANNVIAVWVKTIPRDRRHRSKVDYATLKQILIKSNSNHLQYSEEAAALLD